MKNTSITYIFKSTLFSLGTLLALSCNAPQPNTEEPATPNDNLIALTQPQFDLAKIEIGKITKRMMSSELKVTGLIDVPPQSNISITIPYGGFVKYTEMLPGTQVKKGQFLVSVENPEFIQFQQAYLEALANQSYLKSEYERQDNLFKENVASAKNYEQSKANYLVNESQLQAMGARLKLIGISLDKVKNGQISTSVNVYSPAHGAIRAVYTNTGKYINPHDVIMDITNADDLHVELNVYESDIPNVHAGQGIRFALANDPNNWREATVFLVGSNVRENRSVTVHGHLKQKYPDLLPGMYVSAKIETGSKESWAAPEQAIVRFNGKHYIFSFVSQLVQGTDLVHNFQMSEVTLGNLQDGYSEVTMVDASIDISTLALVTKGAFTLLAKAKNIEEEE